MAYRGFRDLVHTTLLRISRWEPSLGDGGGRYILGTWEICFDGEHWKKDFDLNYTRVG